MSTDFWNLSDGSEVKNDEAGEFDSGGGDFEPIPAKTSVLAAADEVKWDDYQDEEYISIRWSVLQPAEYKNRKIFQKVKVNEPDSKKADKAKRMLLAIDSNAGGNLVKLGKQPDDQDLQKHLCNKPMILMLQVWKLESESGETISGNWVSAVSPRNKKTSVPSTKKSEAKKPVENVADNDDDIDDDIEDDIPF